MRALRKVIRIGVVLGLAATAPAQITAAAPVAAPEPVSVANNTQQKGLTAIIAAPSSVRLHETKFFPVEVQVISLNGQALPEKVMLRAGFGRWEGSKDNGFELKLQAGNGSALLDVSNVINAGKEPLPIWVTPVATGNEFIGPQVNVTLREQTSIESTEPPKILPSDGKSTGKITVIIKDQYGQPLNDVPCVMRYQYPDASGMRADVAHTNAQGRASFSIPASSKQGEGFFQVATTRLATNQVTVSYKIKDKKEGQPQTTSPTTK